MIQYFKYCIGLVCIFFTMNSNAQTVDTVKYSSAKAYIKAKEEKDSNTVKIRKSELKLINSQHLKKRQGTNYKRFSKRRK